MAFFHCSSKTRKAAAKSKHKVHQQCEALMRVLALQPERGPVIPGFAALRKTRVHVPQLACGSSGGYRAIYSVQICDQVPHVVFLACYFKGDCEDLDRDEYRDLSAQASELFSDPDIEWTEL